MTRLKHLGTAMAVTVLALTTSYGYLLENSFFDEDIAWDDGAGWDRYSNGDLNAITREDWANGAPGDPGAGDFYGQDGDGNFGVAFHGERSTGGGFFQAVEGIVPGAEYYFEIESHAGCDSPAGANYPTNATVFQIDFEWYDGSPSGGGSILSTSANIIVPNDGGCDSAFPPGYAEYHNWETWSVTGTAAVGATHMQVVMRWDGAGTNSVGTSNAFRWDNALLTTSAEDPLNKTEGLGDVLRMSYDTESSVSYVVQSTPDLTAGFGDTSLPGVTGDDTAQDVYFAADETANAYRLKVTDTPLDLNFTVHPYDEDVTPNWIGYMDVSELSGTYLWGSSWGVDDLVSDISAATNGGNTVVTLSPNTIGDPNEYWYIGGGAPGNPGNKLMGANLYNEYPAGELAGVTMTFSGEVVANTLSNTHTAVAFIKDFAPDYSSQFNITTNLAPGPFSIELTTDPGAGRHVQYGFTVTGPNVWVTDVAPFGNVQVAIEAGSFVPAPVYTDLNLDSGNVLSWDAQLGVYFQPEYSDDLGSTWFPLGPTIQGDGTMMKRLADPAGSVAGRTYRVVRTPAETPPAPGP